MMIGYESVKCITIFLVESSNNEILERESNILNTGYCIESIIQIRIKAVLLQPSVMV
jgi:hypothetical protein